MGRRQGEPGSSSNHKVDGYPIQSQQLPKSTTNMIKTGTFMIIIISSEPVLHRIPTGRGRRKRQAGAHGSPNLNGQWRGHGL